MGPKQTNSIVAGCAAMSIINAAAKIADATEMLESLVRQLDEAIIDAGGTATEAGRELHGIWGTVVRLSMQARDLLYYAQADKLVERLPENGYAALQEVVQNILAVASPKPAPTQPQIIDHVARVRAMRAEAAKRESERDDDGMAVAA
jgi:hypothetical protein